MTVADLRSALSGIRHVLLDVDDTILDTRAAMVAAGTVASASIWPGGHDHVAMAQRYYDDPGGWFRRFAAGSIAIEPMRKARLADVADAFGVTMPADAHERYVAAFQPTFRESQRLFDDVPDLLAALAAVSVPVGLLTNSTDWDTTVKLEALGLADRFAVVVTKDTLGFGKPDSRIYLEACRLLGAAPESTVCIGDSLEWDVLGAERAGLRAVWLDRDDSGDAPDREGSGEALGGQRPVRITSLDEVTAALLADGPSRFGAGAADR